jgi:hypothetical protein
MSSPADTAEAQAAAWNPQQATHYLLAHDGEVKVLDRKPRHELAAIYTSELAARGIQQLGPCPMSKDELVNAISDLRFPFAQQARDIRAADALGLTVPELIAQRGC